MSKFYEPFWYVDIDALRDRSDEDTDDDESANRSRALEGRTLIVMSSRGLEVVRVPKLLN